MHIWHHCMLHYFYRGKSTDETTRNICDTYDEHTVSESTCHFWFQNFWSENFDVNHKPRCGQFQEMKDKDLNALLAENAAQSSMKQWRNNLPLITRRLHVLGKKNPEEREVGPTSTIYALLASGISTSAFHCLLDRNKKFILYKIVIGWEKRIKETDLLW